MLSFGIAYNFVIDKHFLDKYNCTVWSFDPSMVRVPGDYRQGPKHRFFYEGIGAVDGRHQGESTLYGDRKTGKAQTR